MTSASRRAWPRARRVHMRQARTRAPPPTCSRAGSPSEGVKVQPLTRGKRSQPSPHRTEEERERDRADRERRRAERAGEDSPPVAPPVPPSTGAATPQPLTEEHAALENPLPAPVAQAAREDPAAEQAAAGTAAVHQAPAVGPRLPPAPPARSTGGPIAMRGHRLAG